MSEEPGPVTAIGPECFASADASVICWQGVNYYREPGDDELARVFVAMDGMTPVEVPAQPTCSDPAHEHLASSCEVRDELRAQIEAAILSEAATWEVQFDAGPGQVVGVPDAAFVAARVAERFRDAAYGQGRDDEADGLPLRSSKKLR
jgi:hypothetical protein